MPASWSPHFTGDPSVDVVLLSFGSIKHNTAHGGGVALIRDAQLLTAMRQRYAAYPQQTQRAYLKRLAKNTLLYALLNYPATHVAVRGLFEGCLGKDPSWVQ